MSHSAWEPFLLAAVGVLIAALPWHIYVSTLSSPRLWLTTPDLLAALVIVASAVWGAITVADGHWGSHELPSAVTAILVGGADQVRRHSILDDRAPVLPRWFVPAILVVAIAGGLALSADAALAALVMASPAMAIIATPAAFGIGSRRARSGGIRLDNLKTLEAATRVDTLVLEKDGTLTTGDLTVISVDAADPDNDRNIRWFAGALEKASDHRVGRAIAELSAQGRLDGVEVEAGRGIRGSVDRHPVRVGSPAWIGVTAPETIWTAVGVEVDGRSLGTITVADDVRPDVLTDVARLTELGLDVILVSSDSAERTRHVAGLANVSTVHAECGPGDVSLLVNSLTEQGRRVATVGTPNVRGAELAITSASEGHECPSIVADDCSPARVAEALRVARHTASRINQARRLAIVLGLLGAGVAATGVIGPVLATGVAAAFFGAVAVTAIRP